MINVARLLREEDAAWHSLCRVFEQIPVDRFEEPILTPEGWSPKDAMFHVAGWMGDCAVQLERMSNGAFDVKVETRETIERQNQAWFEVSSTMSLADVRHRFDGTRRRMVEAFDALDEPPPEAVEWFEESGALHYAKHSADLARMGGVRTRLGIMGGTFDPIHYGHLVAAEEALAQFHLDELLFVPTGRPWMKEHEAVSPPEDRYLMTVIATASNPLFGVSRVEVDRDGPTYAVETLRELKHARGDDTDLFFITGADAVLEIVRWKQPDELFALAHFIAATRPGFDLEAFEAHAPTKHPGITVMSVPALAISSTDVRTRVHAERPIRYLVPEGVKSYIEKAGLYR